MLFSLISILCFAQLQMPPEILPLNKSRNLVGLDIARLKPIVPSKLFRGDFCYERYIDTDASGNSIINKEKFLERFMSESSHTTPHLPNPTGRSRRGAYAAATLRTTNYSIKYQQFRITEACRDPISVASLEHLLQDERFADWIYSGDIFLQHKKDAPTHLRYSADMIQAVRDYCFIGDSYIAIELNPAQSMDPYKNTIERLQTTEEAFKQRLLWCDTIAADFLDDNDISIVLDAHESKGLGESFYIRNPDCIESVQASPAEILSILSQKESAFLFIDDLTPEQQAIHPSNVWMLPSKVLALLRSMPNPSKDVLEGIKRNLTALTPPADITNKISFSLDIKKLNDLILALLQH